MQTKTKLRLDERNNRFCLIRYVEAVTIYPMITCRLRITRYKDVIWLPSNGGIIYLDSKSRRITST